MRIAFMGTPDFSVKCLEALIQSGNEVGLVVTQTDKAKDRGKKVQFTPVKELALFRLAFHSFVSVQCGEILIKYHAGKKETTFWRELP